MHATLQVVEASGEMQQQFCMLLHQDATSLH
jgi:hypothetical protein